MQDDTRQDTFADVVAGMDDQIPCASFYVCDNEAVWWGDVHGCEQASICTTHVMKWLEDSTRRIATHGYVRCWRCGCSFSTVEKLGTFRPL